ncbi:MAG TPA: HD domain-containing protein [Candidatus Polarisedimenticolaceae bacterium]
MEALDPQDAVRALAREVAAQAGGRALIVGGYVRDRLVGRETLDVDVEVHGVPTERLEPLLDRMFPRRLNVVGRSFGVFKIHLARGVDLDVAIPRRDSKAGPGHQGFVVEGDPYLGPEEAARRRDFTVNAVALDPITGEILDPWGGVADLRARVLRVVDPSQFGDDPLRVWRGVQIAARFDLVPEPGTLDLMRGMVARGDLRQLSRERVTEELRKLFVDAPAPSKGLELARAIGAIRELFPELEAYEATPQEPEWHPEGNVWIHTMLVVDRAAELSRRPAWGFDDAQRLQVVLGALLHDVGKPVSTTRLVKDGVERVVSPGHESAGEPLARAVLSRLTFGEEVERAVVGIVKWHALPHALHRDLEKGQIDERAYVNAVRKLVKRLHPTPWRVFLAACEADWRGRAFEDVRTGPHPPGDRFAATVAQHALDVEPAKPLVQGRDALALGVPPGPEMGRLIAAIENARDRGEVRTREEALVLLSDLVARRSTSRG